MAIIINQDNSYEKIVYDGCYINKNGLYTYLVTYKSKAERDKEKLIEQSVSEFLKKFNNEAKEIEFLNITPETEDLELKSRFENFQKLYYIVNNLHNILYKIEYVIEDQKNNFIDLTDEELSLLAQYGFQAGWNKNPVIILRKAIVLSDSYKKQEFNLESFYNSLKENIYTDENGNLLVQDDL
jgi:hypothetical protein